MKYYIINDRVEKAASITEEQMQYIFKLRARFVELYSGFSTQELRHPSELTDAEMKIIAGLAHQKSPHLFSVKRDSGITHLTYTNDVGITDHVSFLKNHPSICSNLQFSKTDKEEFKTYAVNIGKINLSSKRPIPYLAIADYIRQIGILTQYTYLNNRNEPVTLMVDDLIKLEWAKTTTPPNKGV